MTVTFSPILALRRPIGPGPWTWATAAATVGGPATLRFSACGCGMYSKISATGFLHGRWGRRAVGAPLGFALWAEETCSALRRPQSRPVPPLSARIWVARWLQTGSRKLSPNVDSPVDRSRLVVQEAWEPQHSTEGRPGEEVTMAHLTKTLFINVPVGAGSSWTPALTSTTSLAATCSPGAPTACSGVLVSLPARAGGR